MASQMALKEIIEYNFPNKKVLALGAGSIKFNYIGQLDRKNEPITEDTLLIIVDTPDKRRVDLDTIDGYKYLIKIDHHPFVENFCDIEMIDDSKSSASEMVADLVNNTKLKINSSIAEMLFVGIVADTERFMFDNAKPETFITIGNLIKDYNLNIKDIYDKIYLRPFNEAKFQGYMALNMQVSNNGLAYVKITKEVINEYKIDSASAGNMINQFNFIDEVLVWVTVSEDVRNNCIRLSIRSRGPIINKIAEKYSGGGHQKASGARVKTFEEADQLLKELDDLCLQYKMKCGEINEN